MAAHDAGLVHRDFKPQNVMRSDEGVVKVLDFGLAKLADSEANSTLTQQGKVFGTPRYMSPEQAQGEPLDARSDLYTLGVVFFELITGRALFDAGSMVALLVKHISDPPPLPSSIRPDLHIDSRLEAIVLKALAKKPADRYASCDEFARALEPFAYPAANAPGSTGRGTGAPPRFPPARPDNVPGEQEQPEASPPPGPQPEGASEEGTEDFDDLLSGFLSDLTPLDHLAEDNDNPFAGYTPDKPKV